MTQQQILTAASLDELRKCWRTAVAKSDDESLSDRARRVADEIADDVRAEIQKRGEVPNPIEKTVALRKYPGWEVCCYADGTFVARQTNGLALGPVENSFQDAVYFAKHGEPKLREPAQPILNMDPNPRVAEAAETIDADVASFTPQPDTRILFRWSPAQIAEMDAAEAQGVIDFHTANPPTMDYMTEFNRSMTEMRLAKERLAELGAA